MKGGQTFGEVVGVFPRADVKASIEKMRELEDEDLTRAGGLAGQEAGLRRRRPRLRRRPRITIDDFVKVDLRVGLVMSDASG